MVNTGISNKIKAIREAKGLNHREFAEPLHVSASYISQIEAGKKMPGDSLLDLIMLKYNVSTEWWEVGTCPIFREETKKNPPGNMMGLAYAVFEEAFDKEKTIADEMKLMTDLVTFLTNRKKDQ